MTKQQIENCFKIIEEYQDLKEKLSHIEINWETDLEKMDFSKLRSNVSFDKTIARIDKYAIERFLDNETELNNFLVSKETIALIKFICTGAKIIPPLQIKLLKYNGETYKIEEMSDLCFVDGNHRLTLSTYLGLKEIPVIVSEYIKNYQFPVSKWDFDYNDTTFTAKSKNGKHEFVFEIERMNIWEDLFFKNIVEVVVF